MRIEATSRLTAVSIDPDAFTDKQGEAVLKQYNPRGIGFTVKTQNKNVTLSVVQDSGGARLIRVYVLVRGESEPVGLVAFRPMWTKLFMPHTYFRPEFRRAGYAKMVYKWALNSSMGFIAHDKQSPGAAALWASLAKEYKVLLVNPQINKVLCEDDEALKHSHLKGCELILLGRGVTVEQFKRDFDFK